MDMKKLFVFAFALILLSGFAVAYGEGSTTSTQSTTATTSTSSSSKIMGKDSASTTMYVFTDFQEPFSALWYQDTFPRIKSEYIDSGKLKVVFHIAPVNLHLDSMDRAYAAECASQQGEFFRFVDAFYKDQDEDTDLDYYMSLVTGLDSFDWAQFKDCFNSDSTKTAIKKEINYREEKGFSGIPAFTVGSQAITGAQRFDVFKNAIEGRTETSSNQIITQVGTYKIRKGDSIEIRDITAYVREISWALQGDTEVKVEISGMNAQVCTIHKDESCKIFYGAKTDSGNKGIIITASYIQKDESRPENSAAEISIQMITAEKISEKVTCYFEGSKEVQQCYTTNVVKAECTESGSCIADISGPKGEKVAWKSSCGGYQYTIMDGNDEKVIFNCGNKETTETEVATNAFRNAYWQCYDGKEANQGGESSCKSYDLWKKYALDFCEGHCSSESGKCGVNSFGLNNPCYSDEKTVITPTKVSDENRKKFCEEYLTECKSGRDEACAKWEYNCKAVESTDKPIKVEDILICKDSCASDGKCYPFGYRKDSKFCADIGAFVNQTDSEGKCENNFECGSNVCVSGKCVAPGLIDNILNWFKKLFG